MGIEDIAELRLPDQNNLHQLFPVGLQVRQKPQLLQYIFAQVLCFVDEQDYLFAPGLLANEKIVQIVDQIFGISGFAFYAQLIADGFDQLFRAQGWVENISRDGVVVQIFKKVPFLMF